MVKGLNRALAADADWHPEQVPWCHTLNCGRGLWSDRRDRTCKQATVRGMVSFEAPFWKKGWPP